jgi:hypothetical protein
MKFQIFFALIALSLVGCGATDSTGSCTLTATQAGFVAADYCQDGEPQSTCENTNGTVQQGVKVNANFSESSCKDLGYTETCSWSQASDGDKYRCKPPGFCAVTYADPTVTPICSELDQQICDQLGVSPDNPNAGITTQFSPTSCAALGFPNKCTDGSGNYCK